MIQKVDERSWTEEKWNWLEHMLRRGDEHIAKQVLK